jgi:hypothetical protein
MFDLQGRVVAIITNFRAFRRAASTTAKLLDALSFKQYFYEHIRIRAP